MRFARDVMTPNPKWISSEEPLINTIDLFFKSGIHYAPVVTPQLQVLGLLSETALVKATLRHYLDAGKNERVGAHRDLLDPAPFISDGAAIQDVMRAMMESPSKRILVQDGQFKLVGIISPKDILRKVHGEHISSAKMSSDLKDLNAKKDVKSLEELIHVYREIFENSPLLMHSTDAKGVIVMANRRLHSELGYEVGDLVGKPALSLYPSDLHHEISQALQTTKDAGHSRSTLARMLRKDGIPVFVDMVSSAIKGSDGGFLSSITASRTINDSKDLLTSLLSRQNDPGSGSQNVA